jgi:hypothetical protein
LLQDQASMLTGQFVFVGTLTCMGRYDQELKNPRPDALDRAVDVCKTKMDKTIAA